jgi:hypothetical protein
VYFRSGSGEKKYNRVTSGAKSIGAMFTIWLQNLCSRRNKNIAAVALANKNARIVWALLTKGTDFLPEGQPAFAKPARAEVLISTPG